MAPLPQILKPRSNDDNSMNLMYVYNNKAVYLASTLDDNKQISYGEISAWSDCGCDKTTWIHHLLPVVSSAKPQER